MPAEISGLSKGGLSRLTIRLRLTLVGVSSQIACGAWLWMSRISGIVRLYGVVMSNLPAMNASTPRRGVLDDRVLDPVEIGPVLFPVIRVAGDLDPFVRLELDQLERAGADRLGAHLARRHVAGVDRPTSRKPTRR